MAGIEYPDVLADRYATDEMVGIWSPEQKTIMERELWLAVLEAQDELGFNIARNEDGTVMDQREDYLSVLEDVDLESIAERERKSRHDVKAKIEEFDELAGGHGLIHLGMTSRDLTENVEQMQVRRSLELTRTMGIAALIQVARLALEHTKQPITGRSHNVAAQVTTLGKRFANIGEESGWALKNLDDIIESYPLRGIKGPMGTQQDMLDLADGDEEKVQQLERRVAEHLGFESGFTSVGQVYPRSMDYKVVSALYQMSAGPSNLANNIRLMAGHELVTEGFKEGQVGSSAMPHKMNTRSSERINGFRHVLSGYETMVKELAGDQWNEGDVSCSVVRRVALPNAFFAIDGLHQTYLTVLNEFGHYPVVIEKELERYAPFLATTKLLVEVASRGMSREAAHDVIKEHAVQVAKDMREKGLKENDLYNRLAQDSRFPLGATEIEETLGAPVELAGTAGAQVVAFVAGVEELANKYPEAREYQAGSIL